MKRIINSKLPLIVYNPSKVYCIEYFRSIHEAGGLPVFDTEFFSSENTIHIIREMEKEKILFGARINCKNKKVLEFLNDNPIRNLDLIVLFYFQPEELNTVTSLNNLYKLFVEVTHTGIQDKLDNISLHGLILKGKEAPGKVSVFTSFVLMQWYLEHSTYPVFIHGGVGFHTAAGIFLAGAQGIVLDDQLYLTDEAPLFPSYKKLISEMDEKDTLILEDHNFVPYRFFSKPGTRITKLLQKKDENLTEEKPLHTLYDEICCNISEMNKPVAEAIQSLIFLGQDAVFANHFRKRSAKVGKVIYTLFSETGEALNVVDGYDPMVRDSPLAKEYGTKYPVIQGPMANVSDNAAFALKVFENGALPFLALGNLPKKFAENILKNSASLPCFGVGLIGSENISRQFEDHVSLLPQYRPSYTVIAGGTPQQVRMVESLGIPTYLHIPSVNSIENALRENVRRFIFEGSEAGGHVGSMTSFILWESALEYFSRKTEITGEITIIFAGGISNRFASYFISGLSSQFSKKGFKIGISMGTPYLFSREITETHAIKNLYQDLIIKNNHTILIGSTVGLSTRTLSTPFTRELLENELHDRREGLPIHERKKRFEDKNSGALLVAAKSKRITINKNDEQKPDYLECNEEEHFEGGNFMVGDSLSLFSSAITIKQIHDGLFESKSRLFETLNEIEIFSSSLHSLHDEIAVIGIGGIFPDARNCSQYWHNIITKKYSIIEVPSSRFDTETYYDKNRQAEDKSYSHIGGVIADFVFDHKKYGYTEKEAEAISRSQKLALEAAFMAVEDAGYMSGKKLSPEKTGVIIGTCFDFELVDRHHKYFYPELRYYLDNIEEYNNLDESQKELILNNCRQALSGGYLNEKLENIMVNVEASRIAKHLGLRGHTYSLDAACASSLLAIDNAIRILLSGENDYMIVGGTNSSLTPEMFVGFSKMGGLSDDGSFPFDERANGFVIGEGAGVIILKRMRDALRDHDKIYGIIKAVGTSSDGKGKAIAAPNSAGQQLAIKRCFQKIQPGLSFHDIEYIEAHGTSTTVGDETEIQTLKSVYQSINPIGLSSVKSQIGHLMGGAGIAGMIKALLALKNKILPPNGRFNKVSEKIKLQHPFYIIQEAKEWNAPDGKSRKAAVSAFGFGGINAHIVLEEYTDNYTFCKRKIFNDPLYNFNNDRIVVVGFGCVLPDAKNAPQYWENLMKGKKSLYGIPEDRVHNEYYAKEKNPEYHFPKVKAGIINDYQFDGLQFKIPPKTLKFIDRHQLFAMDAASQAIEQTKLSKVMDSENKVGVIFGSTLCGENLYRFCARSKQYQITKAILATSGIDPITKQTIAKQLEESVKSRFYATTEDTFNGYITNLISGRIANFYNGKAANYTVDSASASSATALSVAVKNLQCKDMDFIITGGSDCNISPSVLKAFASWGILSPDETRYFDTNAAGVNLGEGSVAFILTRYHTAIENNMEIFAELTDCSFYTGKSNHMLGAPDIPSYNNSIERFYSKSAISPDQVCYIELNGISNVLFDQVEYQALQKVFRKPLHFSNIKPLIGYLKSTHPAAVLLKLILMNHYKTILPDHYYNGETGIIRKNSVLKTGKRQLDDRLNRYFAANFFGIGGNHVHTVVSNLPLWLHDPDNLSIKEIQKGKTEINVKEMEKNIESSGTTRQPVAVLFPGQGSQFSGMCRTLYESHDIIRNTIDKGDNIFSNLKGYSLRQIMFDNPEKNNQTLHTQPSVFLVSAALFDYLAHHGFQPEYFIGHSLGEFTALYGSGMLSFEDTFRLIMKRAELMQNVSDQYPGFMVALFNDEKETEKLIRESAIRHIWLANKNSGRQTIVSGGTDEMTLFIRFLTKHSLPFVRINVNTAFHTPFFREASESLNAFLESVEFHNTGKSAVYSNVTGELYPEDDKAIKKLLSWQMTSSVEFKKIIENAAQKGVRRFIETGPKNTLTKLIKDIAVPADFLLHTLDDKTDGVQMLERLIGVLKEKNMLDVKTAGNKEYKMNTIKNHQNIKPLTKNSIRMETTNIFDSLHANQEEYKEFLEENKDQISNILNNEFFIYRKVKEKNQPNGINFYTGNIVISGVSVGLPGKKRRVFDENNFNDILSGINFIEPLDNEEKIKILNKKITRLKKSGDGSAKYEQVQSEDDVIQLAGQLGHFDLKEEYGIDYPYDITYSLAVAAGIEALKDAGIPLVMEYKTTTKGTSLPSGFALPSEMQERTGVIFSSVFCGYDSLIGEMNKYYSSNRPDTSFLECEKLFYYLMENVKDVTIKRKISEWFFSLKNPADVFQPYEFKKNLLLDIANIGGTILAQVIKAKGPNIHVSAACASITHAICVAEDWIRIGRCDRVIVIAGENASSKNQFEWIGSTFLSMGISSTAKQVEHAAVPFGMNREGTIVGCAGAALIIENEEEVKKRGLNGQAQLLGTFMANSAFHPSRMDVNDIAEGMKKFVDKTEQIHCLNKEDYTPELLFMSHETYTPAAGGSASSEITSLKKTFPEHYRNITVTNTKGYTGHTIGAGIEDAVMIKSLQKGRAPAIANLKQVPDEFNDIRFSKGDQKKYEYGIRFTAGFGSHFSMLFVKKLQEVSIKNNNEYNHWLQKISGYENPILKIINNTLCVQSDTKVDEKINLQGIEQNNSAPTILLKSKKTGDSSTKHVSSNHAFNSIPYETDIDLMEMEPSATNSIIRNEIHQSETIKKKTSTESEKNYDSGTVLKKIKVVISEQTGYTEDMLEDELDMEADLGIDTVKQVEIFGKISTMFNMDVPENLKLSEYNTIAKLSAYVTNSNSLYEEPVIKKHSSPVQDGEVLKKIKSVISEQTGYTEDMLEDELDMEADLGIDTVKQVEIFGKISTMFNMDVPENLKLSEYNTIAKLSAYVTGKTEVPKEKKYPATEKKKNHTHLHEINRYIIRLKETEIPTGKTNVFENKTFIVTPDNYGFSDELIRYIRLYQGVVITIGKNNCDYVVDLSDLQNIEKQLNSILKEHPEPDGFFHFLPLNYYFVNEKDTTEEITSSLKALFLILKKLYTALNRKGSILSALSFDSIVFPYQKQPQRIHPCFSGISGMLKSVKKEWKDTLVKIVDFSEENPLKNIREIMNVFVNELMTQDKRVEAGYKKGKRYVISLGQRDAEKSNPFIRNGSTILVSGGARGITYEIVKALSAEYSVKWILTGTRDITSGRQHLANYPEQEDQLFSRLKQEMIGAKPLEIKKEMENILRNKDVMHHIEYLLSQGVDVVYEPVDVRDRDAVDKLVKKYKIDGIIHAAGIEESIKLEKKDIHSFNRVFDTKVLGMYNLLDALKDIPYDFLIAFSSIAGKFGSEEQIDYAAANEMMGKIVMDEKRKHPDRIYKIFNWTAWKETGMANHETIQKVLNQRGLSFLSVFGGVQFFMNEVLDRKDDEIVIMNEVDERFDLEQVFSKEIHFALIGKKISEKNNINTFLRILDLEKDEFIRHHTRLGVPIFPAAAGIEAMTQAACQWIDDEQTVSMISDIQIPYGIKLLKGKPKEIFIESEPADRNNGIIRSRIFSYPVNLIQNKNENAILHYTANIRFAEKRNAPPLLVLPEYNVLKSATSWHELIYHPERLFVGKLFHTIKEVLYYDNETLVCRLYNDCTTDFITGIKPVHFLTDVIMIDALFQTGGLIQVLTTDGLYLPEQISNIIFYENTIPAKEYVSITKIAGYDKKSVIYNISLIDDKSKVIIAIENFKMVNIGKVPEDHRISGKRI